LRRAGLIAIADQLALAFATAKAHLCATGGDMPRWCPVA